VHSAVDWIILFYADNGNGCCSVASRFTVYSVARTARLATFILSSQRIAWTAYSNVVCLLLHSSLINIVVEEATKRTCRLHGRGTEVSLYETAKNYHRHSKEVRTQTDILH